MYQKTVVTDGSELRVPFGFVPDRVEVLNLDNNRKLVWSSKFAVGVTKLTTEAGVTSDATESLIAPTPSTGLNDTSLGALGILIPLSTGGAGDQVNETSAQTLEITAFREFNK